MSPSRFRGRSLGRFLTFTALALSAVHCSSHGERGGEGSEEALATDKALVGSVAPAEMGYRTTSVAPEIATRISTGRRSLAVSMGPRVVQRVRVVAGLGAQP